jgi:predicted nucleic acid-binding Zn ribbon protein
MSRQACSIDSCDKPSHGRGLCSTHYARFRKTGDPNGGARRSWTPLEDQRIIEFYGQFVGVQVPVRDLSVLLGRDINTVRVRAHKLGVADPTRPMGRASAVPIINCPVCGSAFRPNSSVTCSRSCGQRLRISEGRHAKGMLGKKHTAAAKQASSAASKRMWEIMPDEERERRALAMAQMASRQRPTENTYSRTKKGRRSDLGDMFFRSAWEANYARWLNFRQDVASWEYEPQRFEFPIKRGTNSYLPDFRVTLTNGTIEWHEVKGWMTQKSATALKRFAKYYPTETLVLIDESAYRSIAKFARGVVPCWE